MKSYNGHRSWNAWNVSLWLTSEESSYRYLMDTLERARSFNHAVNIVYMAYRGSKTPDGAEYNRKSIELTLEGLA